MRTGCEGSGRGPPTGIWGGRGPAGRGGAATPGRADIGGRGGCPGVAPPPGRAGDGGAAGRALFGASLGAVRGAGDVGNGGIGVVGRCSSIRRRSVGGTTRPGVGTFAGGSTRGAGATGGSGVVATTGATGGGGAATTGGGSGGTSTTGAGGAASTTTGAGISSTGGGTSIGSTTSIGASATGDGVAVAGFAVLTRRGGGSDGPAGLAGSAFFPGGAPFLPLAAGASAKMSPLGSEMLRSRASRSTNCRATTSSIVLDALLASMPRRLRSEATSWLEVPSSSATL